MKADRADITRPRDLDGKTYAGFGDPGEVETLQQIIRNDGGTGNFTTVTLGTSAYEAVYSGQADFTVSYFAWEGLEAERNGTPMRYFQYTDYGFPDAYSIVINGNQQWLKDHPDEARKFVKAVSTPDIRLLPTTRTRPRRISSTRTPGAFTDEDLVRESQRMLAADYMKDANGVVGAQNLETWSGYSGFLFENGLLAGPDGKPLTQKPDWSEYFTNEYLDAS